MPHHSLLSPSSLNGVGRIRAGVVTAKAATKTLRMLKRKQRTASLEVAVSTPILAPQREQAVESVLPSPPVRKKTRAQSHLFWVAPESHSCLPRSYRASVRAQQTSSSASDRVQLGQNPSYRANMFPAPFAPRRQNSFFLSFVLGRQLSSRVRQPKPGGARPAAEPRRIKVPSRALVTRAWWLQLSSLRSDQLGRSADRWTIDTASDKDATILQESRSVILSGSRQCAEQIHLAGRGIVDFN
jgi:hypothetical protein